MFKPRTRATGASHWEETPKCKKEENWSVLGECPACGQASGEACLNLKYSRDRYTQIFRKTAHPARVKG